MPAHLPALLIPPPANHVTLNTAAVICLAEAVTGLRERLDGFLSASGVAVDPAGKHAR